MTGHNLLKLCTFEAVIDIRDGVERNVYFNGYSIRTVWKPQKRKFIFELN